MASAITICPVVALLTSTHATCHTSYHCLFLLMPLIPCLTIHSLGHVTIIGPIAPLHATCPILAEIYLVCVICLASISARHVSHVKCLVASLAKCHLLDVLIAPCSGFPIAKVSYPYASKCHALSVSQPLVSHQCQVLHHVEPTDVCISSPMYSKPPLGLHACCKAAIVC